MTRRPVRQNGLRASVAAAAARIMAEDGVEDFGLAKRRAARQLQVTELHAMPGNDEIEAALRAYRSLYQAKDHERRSAALLNAARELMEHLAEFRPYLVGPVLRGIAGPFAAIELQLYPDTSKGLEIFLIDQGIAFESRESRRYSGERVLPVSVIELTWSGIPARLHVLDARDERAAIKSSTSGKVIAKASLSEVEAMAAATPSSLATDG